MKVLTKFNNTQLTFTVSEVYDDGVILLAGDNKAWLPRFQPYKPGQLNGVIISLFYMNASVEQSNFKQIEALAEQLRDMINAGEVL